MSFSGKKSWQMLVGSEYYFFAFHNLISIVIFYYWSVYDYTFLKSSWDLFGDLLLKSIVSTIAGRFLANLLLFGIARLMKKRVPNPYQLNFKSKVNGLSIIYLGSLVISSLIYAFGIDAFIIKIFFIEVTLYTILASYLVIKLGAYTISWVFFKIS